MNFQHLVKVLMRHINWRVSFGFLLAPFVPCALLAVIMATFAGQWDGVLFTISAMVLVSVLLSVVVGIPTYLALRRFWKVRLTECLAAGGLTALLFDLSALLVTAFAFPDNHYSAGDSGGTTYIDGALTPHGWNEFITTLLLHVFLGASIGLCFWIIAIWRGPHLPSR